MCKQSSFVVVAFFSIFMSFNALAEPVWVDVRSVLEHKIDNIEGDVRISHGDIVEEFSALHPDKETEVRLYCRSGGRAEKSLTMLKEAGYKNVLNMGSIENARLERGISN